jgi:transcription-repair coupling factor (superfamily II helicase)
VVATDVPGSARAALLACLAEDRPALVVVRETDVVHTLADDLAELLGDDRALLKNPTLSLAVHAELGPDSPLAADWGERLQILQALRDPASPPVVLSSATALLQRIPGPARASEGNLRLEAGVLLDPHELARTLVGRGYRRTALVEVPGEFAIRGGIVDLYLLGDRSPVRVELFGDEVDSLRRFDPQTQRSIGTLERLELPLRALEDCTRWAEEDGAHLLDHLPPEAALVVIDPARCRERVAQGAERFEGESGVLDPGPVLEALAARPRLVLGGAGDDPLAEAAEQVAFPFEPPALGGHDLASVTDDVARLVKKGERLTVACVNDAERERLLAIFADSGVTAAAADGLRGASDGPGVSLVVSPLRGGVRAPESGVWLLPAARLFARHVRRETTQRAARRRSQAGSAVESFADLELGQPVVHVSHGIALFQGVVRRERDGQPRDFLELEFDGGTLFIPTDRIGLVRRYVGPTSRRPRLSKLGGKGWQKKAKKAAEAVRDLAAELLEVQAERTVRPGHAFPPDEREQLLFDESFPYTDTPDQATVSQEVMQDMVAGRAMDRVVCGDVGYGKTELAIRAAFRRAEQKESVKGAKSGAVDILIGTHRLLSKDVAFQDLGLVIVDEEQRFGVEHKERIKEFCRTVDLLTLTATPIPRTLHMALSGARDISVLQTPPPGRSAVETKVLRFDRTLIRRAVERELARDGQVFFVHDRVRTIEKMAKLVRDLVPSARTLVVHGQLPEHQIEERMLAFMNHEADVLVATTLIENGLDNPRANTLIVDRADRHGLSELHQIRGRVGRSSVRAYAYFLLDEKRVLSEIALRRLRAIQEFSGLGAGFQIAMRDLEIRGAGNVLGAEQSGHIVSVGYDLYCRLLKRAVAELRGELQQVKLDMERDLDLEAGEVQVVLDLAAYVPEAYLGGAALKIDCYRRLASAETEDDVDALAAELRDRFGPLPKVLKNLFALRRLRVRAAGHGVTRITRQDRVLQLACRSRERLQAAVVKHHELLRPQNDGMLYVRMQDPKASDEAQVGFLLELLAPVAELSERPKADLDVDKVRAERQRRQRAKEARAEQAALRAAVRRTGSRGSRGSRGGGRRRR